VNPGLEDELGGWGIKVLLVFTRVNRTI
jgi:hypothetical protein